MFLYTFSVVSRCASSLTPPANGTVNCTNGREVGSECFFSCFTDYEFYGSTTRICIDSGNTANWNGSETNCTGESIFNCKQERKKRGKKRGMNKKMGKKKKDKKKKKKKKKNRMRRRRWRRRVRRRRSGRGKRRRRRRGAGSGGEDGGREDDSDEEGSMDFNIRSFCSINPK